MPSKMTLIWIVAVAALVVWASNNTGARKLLGPSKMAPQS